MPGAWTECRECGASLTAPAPTRAPAAVGGPNANTNVLGALALAPPPPLAPFAGARSQPTTPASPAPGFGAPDDALLPGAPPRDVGPDTMLPLVEPIITVAPTRRARVDGRKLLVALVATACVLGAAFSLMSSGGHHTPPGPVLLAPQAPFAGIPTSLSGVVRIEAESSRHTALSVVISAASPNGVPLTLTQLTSLQPGYQWMLGSVPSTTNTMISITSAPGSDVIAVSGTNRTICAYGRWSPAAGSTYVTMDKVQTCSAATAPANGWSTLPGGSAQDLPGVDGS